MRIPVPSRQAHCGWASAPIPPPGPGEVLLSVLACGVCRTDLHLAEGDLLPHGSRRIPGHEVVCAGIIGYRARRCSELPPGGRLVPIALRALDRGGTLAVAGIHLSDIPAMDYQKDLFQERRLRSVTANTRADGREFLALAEQIPLRPTTITYPWTKADQALLDLSRDRFTGAAVLLRPA